MKINVIMTGAFLIVCIVVSGCAENHRTSVLPLTSTDNTVFRETSGSDDRSAMAITDISFSVKNNSSRFMNIYNKYSNPPFQLLLRIDGQTMMIESEPVLEDNSPINSSKPESGKGWRYTFKKRIAIVPGRHTVLFDIPVEGVTIKSDLELHAGANTVTVIPVYKKRSIRPYNGRNFTAGIAALEISAN